MQRTSTIRSCNLFCFWWFSMVFGHFRLSQPPGTGQSYRVSFGGLRPGTEYEIRWCCTNSMGQSPFSGWEPQKEEVKGSWIDLMWRKLYAIIYIYTLQCTVSKLKLYGITAGFIAENRSFMMFCAADCCWKICPPFLWSLRAEVRWL